MGRPSREGRRWMTSNLPKVASSNHLPANSLEVDFGIVLARMLENLKSDPSELRNAAYELARIKLQKECWLRNPPLSVLEMRRALQALEWQSSALKPAIREQTRCCCRPQID